MEKNIIRKERLCVSIPEMAEMLGVSRDYGYTLARMEGFPVVNLGEKRKVIPVKALEEWLDKNARKITG